MCLEGEARGQGACLVRSSLAALAASLPATQHKVRCPAELDARTRAATSTSASPASASRGAASSTSPR